MFYSASSGKKNSALPAGIICAHSVLTEHVAASLFPGCAKLLTNRKYETCLRRKVYVMKILLVLFQR